MKNTKKQKHQMLQLWYIESHRVKLLQTQYDITTTIKCSAEIQNKKWP